MEEPVIVIVRIDSEESCIATHMGYLGGFDTRNLIHAIDITLSRAFPWRLLEFTRAMVICAPVAPFSL